MVEYWQTDVRLMVDPHWIGQEGAPGVPDVPVSGRNMRIWKVHGSDDVHEVLPTVTGLPFWSSSSATIMAGPALDPPVVQVWLAGQASVFVVGGADVGVEGHGEVADRGEGRVGLAGRRGQSLGGGRSDPDRSAVSGPGSDLGGDQGVERGERGQRLVELLVLGRHVAAHVADEAHRDEHHPEEHHEDGRRDRARRWSCPRRRGRWSRMARHHAGTCRVVGRT